LSLYNKILWKSQILGISFSARNYKICLLFKHKLRLPNTRKRLLINLKSARTGEFAFTPSGNIYPCERLIGSDNGQSHCIGNIHDGFFLKEKCFQKSNMATNNECQLCSLSQYCMNWCGCTNYFLTGSYNLVGPFVCASEKVAINSAFKVIKEANDKGLNFSEHLAAAPIMSVIGDIIRTNQKLSLKSLKNT
jgi:radical SAM protein with 4Fe4S-binding SPASM domain